MRGKNQTRSNDDRADIIITLSALLCAWCPAQHSSSEQRLDLSSKEEEENSSSSSSSSSAASSSSSSIANDVLHGNPAINQSINRYRPCIHMRSLKYWALNTCRIASNAIINMLNIVGFKKPNIKFTTISSVLFSRKAWNSIHPRRDIWRSNHYQSRLSYQRIRQAHHDSCHAHSRQTRAARKCVALKSQRSNSHDHPARVGAPIQVL